MRSTAGVPASLVVLVATGLLAQVVITSSIVGTVPTRKRRSSWAPMSLCQPDTGVT